MAEQLSSEIAITQVESTDDAEAMANFFKSVWGSDDDVVPFDLILALVHVGAYAFVARLDGEVVAASFAVRGYFKDQPILHSHVTASVIAGVGHTLKWHQYSWARERGIAAITWTFDPLVRRNCVFNFEKLGATAVEYLPNFYGVMRDEINRGDESDRLLALWTVKPIKNSDDSVGERTAQETRLREVARILLPEDIEGLRKTDLAAALAWRMRVREQMQPLLEQGATVSGMTPDRTALIITAE